MKAVTITMLIIMKKNHRSQHAAVIQALVAALAQVAAVAVAAEMKTTMLLTWENTLRQ